MKLKLLILFLFCSIKVFGQTTQFNCNQIKKGWGLQCGTLNDLRVDTGATGVATQFDITSISSGSPGGLNTQIQYNNSGAFGGVSGATSDGTNLFVPTLTGGSTTTSTLTLRPTSASGITGADIIFQANNSAEVFRLASGSAHRGLLTAGTLIEGFNAFRISATMPTVITATSSAVDWQVTSAGSSSQTNNAFTLNYLAGYTGSSGTRGLTITNAAAGTGTGFTTGNRNIATVITCNATTAGSNVGVLASADNGDRNLGIHGRTTTAKNNALNIGVIGTSLNTGSTPTQVGGYFGLHASSDVPSFTSAALMCDNGSQTSDIFVARDNGTAVITCADGGNTTFTGSVIIKNGAANNVGLATSDGAGFYRNASNQIGVATNGSLRFAITNGGIASATNGGYTLIHGAGSAAAPTYSYTGDAAKGAYSSGTNELAWATSGTQRLVLTSDGRFYGLALHNNAGAVTGATNQYIASGTWTPTLTNVTNITASTAYSCQWMRVGNAVTCSGKVDIDATLGVASELGMSLPIASAMTADENLGGTASSATAASLVSAIRSDATNDRAAFVFTAVSLTNDSYFFEFTYLIK